MPIRPKELTELLSSLSCAYRYLNASTAVNPIIAEVTLDLEEVTKGSLFIARQLWYIDTHVQIEQAIAKGATAIIASQDQLLFEPSDYTVPIIWVAQEDPSLGEVCSTFYEHPTRQLKVYGVTGTNGKTSAVSYMAELLTAIGERVAVMGTVEYRFEDRVRSAPNTTPDALVIQRFARQALDLGATALTLEVSSHALSLERVAGVSFDAVGFTSFSRDHLDFHGSLEEYRNAKGRLFSIYLEQSLRAGKTPVAVAHDDEDGLNMLARVPAQVQQIQCQVGQQGQELSQLAPTATLHLETGEAHITGIKLRGKWVNRESTLQLNETFAPLIGDYHPSNFAIALGMVGGTHPEQILTLWQQLAITTGVAGRMERVLLPEQAPADQRVALVDYAHTPDAISRALQAIRAVHQGHVSVMIGCGGDRDRGKRPKMLQAALAGADMVWLTSDNPRTEDPQQIIDDALAGLEEPTEDDHQTYEVESDRRRCISRAWESLPEQGALLITGKGHETYQDRQGRKARLQDHEALRAAFWAEQMKLGQTSDTDKPSIEVIPFVYSLALRIPSQRQSLTEGEQLSVLREAALREQGLSFRLTSQERQTSKVAVGQSMTQMVISTVSISTLLHELSQLCLVLTPQIREVVFYCEERWRKAVQKELESLLKQVGEKIPKAHIPLLLDHQERPQKLGGWSSKDTGPKIPSLL